MSESCKESNEDCDEVGCPYCCMHEDLDHTICLDCGSDQFENMVAAAEWAFEGDR